MVLGWVNLVAGLFCGGVAAYAAVRRWTPQRWNGLYKQFALAVGGAAVALTAYGVAYLTSETNDAVADAARLVAIAGFLTAGAGLVAARRAERQRQQRKAR